jgi:hypothetical protein
MFLPPPFSSRTSRLFAHGLPTPRHYADARIYCNATLQCRAGSVGELRYDWRANLPEYPS